MENSPEGGGAMERGIMDGLDGSSGGFLSFVREGKVQGLRCCGREDG